MQSPSSVEADAGHKHPRQRASRACTMCHSKKTKCDALNVFPCTRCKNSKLRCTLRVSHRGRANKERHTKNHQGTRSHQVTPDTTCPDHPHENTDQAGAHGTSSSPADLIRSLENFLENPHKPVDDERSVAIVHATNNNALASVVNTASGAPDDDGRNVHLYVGPSSSSSTTDRYNEALARFDPETRAFLTAKGILDLPDARLADHLVQNFFDYADPHVPLIHKVDFLERYKARNVPLLLLQSVFFVGSHFAEPDYISTSAWPSRAHMTASFFEKAKLIADFELEGDQITLVQSFVLLAERWLGWTNERNSRYWMSRAINVAYMMGLHRKIETLQLSPSQRRLWTRVAWVTMARDALVAASFGTPAAIDDRWTDREDTHWDATMLDESRDGHAADDTTPSRSPETIQYSVTLVWLGALVGATLSKLHSRSRSSTEPVTSATLSELEQTLNRLAPACPALVDVELQDAATTPPAQLLYGPLLRAAHALVSLFYYWALAERHRDPAVKQQSRAKLLAAACDVCDVMSYLRAHVLFPLCPIWLVAGVFHTCAVLLADCRDALLASPSSTTTPSFARLRQLNDDLGILEQTWKPAGWFRELIRLALEKLHEKVREREAGAETETTMTEASTTTTERRPARRAEEEGEGEGVLLCESPGSLFESARELFPDLEEVFSWGSAGEAFPFG